MNELIKSTLVDFVALGIAEMAGTPAAQAAAATAARASRDLLIIRVAELEADALKWRSSVLAGETK